ncbi:MAG: hypothetical protein M3Y75_14080 [Actinomycetota bacterium]|nr:hypothetical protein [Actinomycetota bacterium]
MGGAAGTATQDERAAVFTPALGRLLAACDLGRLAPQACRLAEGLHGAEGVVRLGVTELSLTARAGGAPAVRLLAEVVDVGPSSEERFAGALAQLERVAGELGVEIDRERLERLAALASPSHPEAGKRPLRFGLTVGWSADRPPGLKAYFDLGASDRVAATERLREALGAAGVVPAWQRLQGAAIAPPVCQGFGVDTGPAAGDHLRPYLHGAGFTGEGLRRLIGAEREREAGAALDAFALLVADDPGPAKPLRGMLVAPTFHAAAPERPVGLKLDAFLPLLKPDDAAALDAARRLARELGIDGEPWSDAVTAVCGSRDLTRTRGLLHYLSLAIDPGGGVRMALYLRPPHPPNPHQGPRSRPRAKVPALAALDAAIRRAIEFLERDRAALRPAATHRLSFPREMRADGPAEVQLGVTFALAYAANALVAAQRAGFEVDSAGLERDVEELASLRDREVAGGWRYFPRLAPLPPDADDLAEVVRLVAAVAPARLQPLCGPALDVALEGWKRDGSRSTWLLSDADPAGERRRMREAIELFWGDTFDCEVIANLAEAIAGAQPHLPAGAGETVASACAWVIDCQLPDGSWPATWYTEPLYGTWMAARLVALVRPGHQCLRAAHSLAMGAIGEEGEQLTAEQTALALLTLLAIDESVPAPPDALARGAASLVSLQHDDGGWPANPLIRMEPMRTQRRDGPVLLHASPALTAALALGALVGARQGLDRNADAVWTVPSPPG